MSDKGDNVLKVLAPGLWVDTDYTLHLDPYEFVKGQGAEPSVENQKAAEEQFKDIVRKNRPDIPIVDVWENQA